MVSECAKMRYLQLFVDYNSIEDFHFPNSLICHCIFTAGTRTKLACYNSEVCLILYNDEYIAADAETICKKEGGALLSLESMEKMRWFQNNVKYVMCLWNSLH